MTSSYFDQWLDEYNDYIRLYEMFGDKEYLDEAIEIRNSLQVIVARAEKHKLIVSKVMSSQKHAYGKAYL
ncbi:hypothetical protein GQF01_18790 [Paenibacillus sp. 5J-6]|jgi:vacuolar-type H+-ATPase catalytic subunit A/Vma1|uniref:Uncharacterized protein n=1 Tax=Paenibacillus silvestris TaxID=2606219 RepID=A0A6L8V1Q2_9BACL|nr:hypothetical protein [Paenibacillus silvestris]MZQ84167.1 hypothetical protein [Paenibacillus silvestris]